MSTGLSPSDSIGMPVAAWILSECLITWTTKWGPSEAEAAALTMKDTILANTENETLNYQCYWLATTIAIGGIIRVTPSPNPNALQHVPQRFSFNLFDLLRSFLPRL